MIYSTLLLVRDKDKTKDKEKESRDTESKKDRKHQQTPQTPQTPAGDARKDDDDATQKKKIKLDNTVESVGHGFWSMTSWRRKQQLC